MVGLTEVGVIVLVTEAIYGDGAIEAGGLTFAAVPALGAVETPFA